MIEGVLVIDKPQGLTSHDVVAVARRTLRETRIGHTGTLDPLATGVLPLVIGRATRLVRFLTAADKEYDATIRFGITTDSYDITGTPGSRSDAIPSREAIEAAFTSLRGAYLQTPPAFSAKRVEGRRAYDLARRDEAVTLAPVPVRVARAELLEVSGASARVALTCSAGFYVRSFAHTLGQLVGTGACLEALRRTRSGDFALDMAAPFDALQDPSGAMARIVPVRRLLPGLPAVRVTAQGRSYVAHGRELKAGDYDAIHDSRDPAAWVRIVDEAGALIAVGTQGTSSDSLHPTVVLI